MVSTAAPAAVGYVSASDDEALTEQREAITEHARAAGYALAQIVTDRFNGFTISQVLDAARVHDARLVIVPADTTLATARARLAHDLEPCGAACAVIEDCAARTGEPGAVAVEPRLTEALRRRTPRHAARKDEQ